MEMGGLSKLPVSEKKEPFHAKDRKREPQFRGDGSRCNASSSDVKREKGHMMKRTHHCSEKIELRGNGAQIQRPSFLHNQRTPDHIEVASSLSPSPSSHVHCIWTRRWQSQGCTSHGWSPSSYHRAETERMNRNNSTTSSRLSHEHRLRQINEETLSPLVLHPHPCEDITRPASYGRPHYSFVTEGHSATNSDSNTNEEDEDEEDSDMSSDEEGQSSGMFTYRNKASGCCFRRTLARRTQTQLEGYNGSEEFGGSSIYSDGGRISTSELEGELELESYPDNMALDKHNKGGRGPANDVDIGDGGLQITNVSNCKELGLLCDYKPRSLSQKYRPRVFEDVVGQHIVTQALASAISKGKIAPVYLFHGSRGTGKTSVARIFASALLCLSTEGSNPCGICIECINVATGRCPEVREVDAASNNGIERVKILLDEALSSPPISWYKVFVIDECHVLTPETWSALLKVLEEPPMNVVFVLITTDPDHIPRTALSRCQRFPFMKIRESDIVERLQKLALLENLTVDINTLQLIASRSEGSLRDAETTLDQVSLLGHQIKASSVYELVGLASHEKMLSLLDSALQADTVTTVRQARELIDSGVEPLSLMAHLATSITDILGGSFMFTEKQSNGFFRKQPLSEAKLETLRMALKQLVEAEKQLRACNDRTTWLTAALLQLVPPHQANTNPHTIFLASCEGTSVTQSSVALDDAGAEDFEQGEHEDNNLSVHPYVNRVEENENNANTSSNVNRVEEALRMDGVQDSLTKSVSPNNLVEPEDMFKPPALHSQPQHQGFRKDTTNGCYPEGETWFTRNNMRRDVCSEYKSCFERDGIEALSLESHGLAVLNEKSRNHMRGDAMDGRRSCDAHPHITRTSTLKMIRKLSMRDHMKAPPSPDYDTKSKGMILRFPRFSTRGHHALPRKLVDVCDAEEEAQSSRKSSTLKGTLARLFLKETYKYRRRNE